MRAGFGTRAGFSAVKWVPIGLDEAIKEFR